MASFKLYLPLIFKPVSAGPPPETGFGSGVIGAHNQTYNWSLASAAFTAGKVYYVCVIAEDSDGNKAYGVSSAPVIKVPAQTGLLPD